MFFSYKNVRDSCFQFSQKLVLRQILTFLCFLLFSFSVFSANGPDNMGRTDYDLDNDGLIEINDLADLDEIRTSLDGKSLYQANVGCPTLTDGKLDGCIGYELTADLDFDTNADGRMDEKDTYWNSGLGWNPLGRRLSPVGTTHLYTFNAIFQGNGHTIKNLYINRPDSNVIGLFAYPYNATIKNLGLTGNLGSITGAGAVGSIAGQASSAHLEAIFNSLSIKSSSSAGGIIGENFRGVVIKNSTNYGKIQGTAAGGLVGYIYGKLSIFNSLNIGLVKTNKIESDILGGLVGGGRNREPLIVSHSYWAKDLSQQDNSYISTESTGYIGLSASILRCATQANTTHSNSNCVSSDSSSEDLTKTMPLFKDWDNTIWDFGTSDQMPILRLGIKYRDSDADGILDDLDAFPLNYAASVDSDNDGHPDHWLASCDSRCIKNSKLTLDKFQTNSSAWKDADNDGLPDTCNANCLNSGLKLDTHLNDFDNDGIVNNLDIDDDGNGKKDVDTDDDGLIEIDNLAKLNAIRFSLEGHGLKMTTDTAINSEGCPFVIINGKNKQACHGYELTQDLNFDTNDDGEMDTHDVYWNTSKGWDPIGSKKTPFSAVFQGNGHVLKNLYINDPNSNYIGLFAVTNNASIKQVGLIGLLGSITGDVYVGSFIGKATNTRLETAFNSIKINGSFVGGLIGKAQYGVVLRNTLNIGEIQGAAAPAGLISHNESYDLSIINSLNIGKVKGGDNRAGLLASGYPPNVTYSYWAQDLSQQRGSLPISFVTGNYDSTSYIGLNASVLRCAIQGNTTSNNSQCVSSDGEAEGLNKALILYNGWDDEIWDFGTNDQLPGLKLGNKIYRDSDGDGLLDEDDNKPLDYDNDGITDKKDSFPLNVAASVDADNDDKPDFWNDTCDPTCRASSGLLKDSYLNDTDNDGVSNDTDQEFNKDNGKPNLINVGADIKVSVNSENSSQFIMSEAMFDKLFTNVSAIDAVDGTNLALLPSINDKVLERYQYEPFVLPSGLQVIKWVAVDQSGNISNTIGQNIFVYPQVRFALAKSVIGKASTARILAQLSGESPEYPIHIDVIIDGKTTTALQADVVKSFDFTKKQTVVIEAGNNAENLNTEAPLLVSILDNDISESDKLLTLELDRARIGNDTTNHKYLLINDQEKTHALTITDKNLAPKVTLEVKQGGKIVTSAIRNTQEVTITAIISDPNGKDQHNLEWHVDSLYIEAAYGRTITFNPSQQLEGNYLVSVKVIDNGIGTLSDRNEINIMIVNAAIGTTSSNDSSGGGALSWLTFIMLILFTFRKCRQEETIVF